MRKKERADIPAKIDSRYSEIWSNALDTPEKKMAIWGPKQQQKTKQNKTKIKQLAKDTVMKIDSEIEKQPNG